MDALLERLPVLDRAVEGCCTISFILHTESKYEKEPCLTFLVPVQAVFLRYFRLIQLSIGHQQRLQQVLYTNNSITSLAQMPTHDSALWAPQYCTGLPVIRYRC